MHENPSFQSRRERSSTDKEVCKSFVQEVLRYSNAPCPTEGQQRSQKYLGNKNFTSMSQAVGKGWNTMNDVMKSMFNELAQDEIKRFQQELFESYKSFARNQWENNTVPTQESMAALGLMNQPRSFRYDMDKTKGYGAMGATGPSIYGSTDTGMKDVASDMPFHTQTHNIDHRKSLYAAQMNHQVQTQEQEKKMDYSTQADTMSHAATMPELNLGSLPRRSVQPAQGQVDCISTHRHSHSMESSVRGHRPEVQTNHSVQNAVFKISEVDLSNELILSMVIDLWDLDLSMSNLPIQNEKIHVSNEDLIDLLTVIIPEQENQDI